MSNRIASLAALPLVAVVLVAAGQTATSTAESGKPHPRLVNVATTKCETCHAKLFEGRAQKHAAADDCSSCHELNVSPGGTTVKLTADEPDLCLTCHAEQEKAARGELKVSHAPVTQSCATCHDPHAAAQPKLLKASVQETCGSCHEVDGLQKSHGGQLVPSVSCTNCHAPHGSANAGLLVAATAHAPFADKTCDACHRPPMAGRVRLTARGEALCLACHSDLGTAPSGGSVHAAVKGERGKSGCLSCHDPHMSAQPKLAVRAGIELCAGCHASVVTAAKAKTGHAAAAADCTSCHKPHASDQPRLLTGRSPDLCVGCHDASDAGLRKAHLGADLGKKDCLACHSPHGAGQPKLLAKNVHAVIESGCDSCHLGASDKLIEDGGAPLCLSCHDDIGKKIETAAVPHAGAAGSCTDCHNPHASSQAKLVKGKGGEACIACHSDQAPAAGEFEHGVISMFGCSSCHEPHGGASPKLLRAQGSALCLSCHAPDANKPKGGADRVLLGGRLQMPSLEAAKVSTILLDSSGQRGHPTPEHPISGTPDRNKSKAQVNFSGELTCFSCHDPHKGKSPKLLKDATTVSESCIKCHVK